MHLVSLSEDVLVETDADSDALVVVSRWGEHVIDTPVAAVRESLHRMCLGPISQHNLGSSAGDGQRQTGADGDELTAVLERISGSVVRSVGLPDRQGPLLSLVPFTATARFRWTPPDPARVVRLSRFATLRRRGDELMIETPQAKFRVVAHRELAAQVVSVLASASTATAVSQVVGVPEPVVIDLLGYLLAAGAVLTGDGAGRFAEDEDPTLRLWHHHELLFHQLSRSSLGEVSADVVSESTSAPVVKQQEEGRRYPLYQPDLAELEGVDASLTALLETDHECPKFSGDVLAAAHLGELLFRSARVRGPGPSQLPHRMTHESSQRPYVNIACLYELELYVSIDRCDQLPCGTFHYDPAGHALTLINDDSDEVACLLDMAKVAAGCVLRPPVLVTMTARMDRLTALGGAAYATALLHAGALQQTLSLVARAIGLAAHPIPVNATDLVERILRLTWPAEVGIGECVIECPKT